MSWLLEMLMKHRDDRGMMANLRCVLVDSKKHRAWPVLNRLGIGIENQASAFIAGLFATHPEPTDKGNFGTTCKFIEYRRDNQTSSDSRLTPTERRFQHLLASDTADELYGRIYRMALMAKSNGIQINYSSLEADLNSWRYFKDQIKVKWASEFWTPGTVPVNEEDA